MISIGYWEIWEAFAVLLVYGRIHEDVTLLTYHWMSKSSIIAASTELNYNRSVSHSIYDR